MVSKLGGVEEPFSSETQMECCLEMLFVGHIGMKTHILTVLEKPIDVFLFQCNSMLTNCEVACLQANSFCLSWHWCSTMPF